MGKIKTLFATAAASATALTLLSLGAMAATSSTSATETHIKTYYYGDLNNFTDTYNMLKASDFEIKGASKYTQATLIAKQGTKANAKYIFVQVQSGSLGTKFIADEGVGSSYTQKLEYDGTINKAYYNGTTFLGNVAGSTESDYQITVLPRAN